MKLLTYLCYYHLGIFSDFPDQTKTVVELVYQNNNICFDLCPEKFLNNNNDNNYDNNLSIFNKTTIDNIILFVLFSLFGCTFLYLFKKIRKHLSHNNNNYTFVSNVENDNNEM